jgi:hypothetical protein
MAKTKKKALYVATESGGFGVDPSANGAGYLQVFATSLSFLSDGKEPLDTDYFTNRNFPTAPIAGPDGGSFEVEVPLIGMATAAGDNVNASTVTDDWLDRILLHIFGQQVTTIGEGVGAASTTTNIVFDADSFGVQDIVPVFEANLPSAAAQRSQLAYLTVDPGTGSYTAQALAAAPTTAAIGYGQKRYLPTDDGGNTLAFYYVEDALPYTLLGCRVTAASIALEARKIAKMKLSVSYDNATQGAKGSIPAIAAAPAVTPLRGLLSPFYFNGVQYATPKVMIDLGITAAVGEATEGINGRGDHINMMMVPKVSVTPLRTDALRELKRQSTAGRLMVQIGAGIFGSSILNLMSFAMEGATARGSNSSDDNNRVRSAVDFTCADPVVLGAASARAVQLNRS